MKLSEEKIREELKGITGWSFENDSIKKTFHTRHYPATMAFVSAIGGFCQRLNHHPDYILMKFKEVEVSFSTHSDGGVTEKDIQAARELETIPL